MNKNSLRHPNDSVESISAKTAVETIKPGAKHAESSFISKHWIRVQAAQQIGRTSLEKYINSVVESPVPTYRDVPCELPPITPVDLHRETKDTLTILLGPPIDNDPT